jgi:hypothetical protein
MGDTLDKIEPGTTIVFLPAEMYTAVLCQPQQGFVVEYQADTTTASNTDTGAWAKLIT